MKDTFEFSRFSRVLKYTWQTQPVLPYTVLLAGIPLMVSYLLQVATSVSSASIFSHEPLFLFCVYFIGSGWLYAGLSFREYGRFGTSFRFLLLPASALEKWLSKVLLVYAVFPLVAWLAYNAAFQITGFLTARWYAFRFYGVDWGSFEVRTALFIFYLSLSAAFASGVVWKRFGLLKGIVFAFVLLLFLYFLVDSGIATYAYSRTTRILFTEMKLPFDQWAEQSNRYWQIFWAFGAYLPSLLLLLSTYFFTSKKEV